MMLGSVFNRYQASTTSEPSKALQTRLRALKIGKDTYPFSEFRGLGPPALNIGLLGDVYIDLTPGFHALYARYPDVWSLWPGPSSRDVSTLLLHPTHSERCLWCNDTVGWFHPRNVRVKPSGTTSELLTETLKSQAAHSEESKKRKRDALGQAHQPTQTKPSSSMSKASSPSQNHTALENPSTTNAPSFLHSTTSTTPGYSQPALEPMIPSTPISITVPSIQNSGHYFTESPTTDLHPSSIPIETDQMYTSNDLKEHSERNLQEPHTSPKRIDLRKIPKKRRATSSAHSVDIRSQHPTNEVQSLPQSSLHSLPLTHVIIQPSIQDSDHATNTDILPSSDITRERFLTERLHDSTSLPAPDRDLPAYNEDLNPEPTLAKATHGNHIVNGLTLDIAVAELRKMTDRIHRLEADNAQLSARLLHQCQSNPSSLDIPPMQMINVETPPAAYSDDLNGEEIGNHKQMVNVETPPAAYSDDLNGGEIVTDIPSGSHLYPRYHPCEEEPESSSALSPSATPCTSLFLADTPLLTETAGSSIHAVPLSESATVDCIDTSDEFKSFESSMNTCPPVKEEIVDVKSCLASPGPTPTLLPMREIHRLVLFAAAGSLLICRICLGRQSGGIETGDEVFHTAEGSPELLQEHCEKEHVNDCEALMNMTDEELLDIISMMSSEW